AVLLAATAVTVAGPIGFVGLCAPALMRMLARAVPPLRKHRVLVPVSAAAGVALVLTADVAVRAAFGAVAGVTLPTGVVTTMLGAAFMVVLAQRMRTGLAGEAIATLRSGTRLGRRSPHLVLLVALGLVVTAALAGVLLGDSTVLLGDVANWMQGVASV